MGCATAPLFESKDKAPSGLFAACGNGYTTRLALLRIITVRQLCLCIIKIYLKLLLTNTEDEEK